MPKFAMVDALNLILSCSEPVAQRIWISCEISVRATVWLKTAGHWRVKFRERLFVTI